MATIKAYTDLEQSKKLAEILPIESADMYIYKNVFFGALSRFNGTIQIGEYIKLTDKESKAYPCWSLAELLSFIPCSYKVYRHPYDDGLSLSLQISNCIEVAADNEKDVSSNSEVKFRNGVFGIENWTKKYLTTLSFFILDSNNDEQEYSVEVIGNIHDNPDIQLRYDERFNDRKY